MKIGKNKVKQQLKGLKYRIFKPSPLFPLFSPPLQCLLFIEWVTWKQAARPGF